MSKSYSNEEKRALIARAEAEYIDAKRRVLLPHLYGKKPYKWTLDFWNATPKGRMKLICGGNQISKSSSIIRLAIRLATDKSLWEPAKGHFPKRKPRVFWYIYPDSNKVFEEWQKWEEEWLPRGIMKDDPDYGWTAIHKKGDVVGVKFYSGVTLYFKTWRTDNQAGTVDAMFVDEEIPAHLYDELSRRLTTTEGMYHGAFTATLGQPFWYEAMELIGKKGERFPDAWKMCVSAYDCLVYADGSPSEVWTKEKIQQEINKCSSDAAVKMRIMGRFASTDGLIYPSFRRERNIVPVQPLPIGWNYYAGVDIGTGGPDGHPATIAIVAVDKNYRKGRVVRLWKGPKDRYTNTTDILNQLISMTRDLNMTAIYYDHQAKEFFLRATEEGIALTKADKTRDFGSDLLNVLFKNQILDIDDTEMADDLAQELETLRESTSKQNAKDDLIDGLRYAVAKIPWDLSIITSSHIINLTKGQPKGPDNERLINAEKQMRGHIGGGEDDDMEAIFNEYNDLMEF